MTTMTAMANLARTRVALARADEDDAKVMVPCLARVMTDDKGKGGSGKGNNDDGKGKGGHPGKCGNHVTARAR